MSRKTLLRNAAVAIAGVLAALALGEAAVRLIYGDKFGWRPGFYVADGELGWIAAPNLDYTFYGPDFSIAVKTDADGCRLGALGEVDYGSRLVLLCGDSYVFGWGVSTDETMASRLDALVYGASGGAMRVVNLGVGGYGTLQYYFRLMRFLKAHPSLDVAALIIVHAENDATDNLKSLGYHIGAWSVADRESGKRSRSHLIKFIGYARSVIGGRKEARRSAETGRRWVGDPYLQDVLFTHEYAARNSYPSRVDFGGHIVSFQGVSGEDWYPERLLERRAMTPLQRELIQVGVELMHRMVANMNITIIHVTAPTMSDWYRDELVQVLEGARGSEGNTVMIAPPGYADPAGFAGRVMNEHSGGHYTPEFNGYWAERTAALLQAGHALPR